MLLSLAPHSPPPLPRQKAPPLPQSLLPHQVGERGGLREEGTGAEGVERKPQRRRLGATGPGVPSLFPPRRGLPAAAGVVRGRGALAWLRSAGQLLLLPKLPLQQPRRWGAARRGARWPAGPGVGGQGTYWEGGVSLPVGPLAKTLSPCPTRCVKTCGLLCVFPSLLGRCRRPGAPGG